MSTRRALAVADDFIVLLRAESFDEIAKTFAPPLRAAVGAEALRLAWTAEVAARGGLKAIGAPVDEPSEPLPVRVRIPVVCANGGFTVITSVGDDGLLHGLRLVMGERPAWQPPPYADPARFTEREILVGTGPLAVPGTLTLPVGPGPWPAVVLLSGGGPFDRDESVGPNKPFKDLAWGLATRQVAVLRFDKVTFARPNDLPPGFTMSDEYLPHALAAVRILRQTPEVAPDRIHLLGHSMGGKAAARVASAVSASIAGNPGIAGIVLLAADAQPMHEALVRVARHLAALAPDSAMRETVAALTRQAALVDSPELTAETPPESLPLGYSAPYWLDLRTYDPVATAAALDRPMLILQGARDYQVTVADDLARWRAILEQRPEVTIRVHEDADHFFFPGTGLAGPTDHTRPGHVDAAVVDGIATWLTR